MEKYQPSNGTEADIFHNTYCFQCLHCDPCPSGAKQCEILYSSMIFNVNDKRYPKEWVYGENGNPTCTKHQKWDWGSDGDPDDPNNPKAPPPPLDPNQMDMFPKTINLKP